LNIYLDFNSRLMRQYGKKMKKALKDVKNLE